MKYLIFILCTLLLCLNAKAHIIKGKINGIREGTKIYLLTHPEHSIEYKWVLSQKVDSTAVKNGVFEFDVPDAAYGRMWLVRSRDNLLKYYFNKNENITIEGTVSSCGLFDEKITGGHARILLEDIMSILDDGETDPIERRLGLEWLKRHAFEDIGLFTTAYFYLVMKTLRHEDVKEILDCVPSQNIPYYTIITDFYQKDKLVQPGQFLPAYTLKNHRNEKVADYQPGHPQLILYSKYKDNADDYSNKAKQLLLLRKNIPDLQLVLIFPEFWKEISPELKTITEEQQVVTGDYQKTAIANPALFYNENHYEGTILISKEGKILALDPENESYESLFEKDTSKDRFVIHGYVSGINEGVAELVLCKKGTLNVPEVADSAIIRNGYFTFDGQVSYPQYCNVGIRGTVFPVGFYLENSSIDVNITVGTRSSKKNGITTAIKVLHGKVYGSHSQKESQYLSFLGNKDSVEEWISRHVSDMPTLMYLATRWSRQYSPDLVEKWLNLMDESLSDQVAYQETQKQIIKRRELAIGNLAPDFILPSDKGEKITLKKFRGKYVLLDFWASWCGPCRGEIPNLKKAWEKYHSEGLEIISITIDRKEEDWRNALAEEDMPWTQLNGRGTKVAALYNVNGIPHILLIDPEGKIIGINLRGEKLQEELQKLLIP